MKKQLWTWLRRVVPPTIFSSITISLLLAALGQTRTLAAAFGEFRLAMVYSFSIGGILSAIVPPLWERSARCSTPLRWLTRVSSIAAATALGTLFGALWQVTFGRRAENFATFYWHSYGVALILACSGVGLSITFETYKQQLHKTRLELKDREVERERALKLATAARLSSLESRVHPHFLFNTLNSVASLIPVDPGRAESMVSQLAGLLRFSLDSAQGGLVPLAREMKIVEDYLKIEKARFGGRLRYSIEVAGSLEAVPVPPLAVQTLVENAVKYAVGPRLYGATIQVSAQSDAAELRLVVRDDGPGFSWLDIPAGHGLNNLEERLAAIYGEKGKLGIESSAEGTTVTLAIPLGVAKAA